MQVSIFLCKRQIVVLLKSIGATIMLSAVAFACSCAPTTIEMERDEATVIFAGKVFAVEKVGLPSPILTREFPFIKLWGPFKRKNTFEVTHIWKGTPQEKFDISSCVGMMCCTDEFKLGDEFLIYAYGNINDLGIGMCTRKQKLENATEDLAILGAGQQISQNTASTKKKSSFWSIVEDITAFFKR